MGGQQSTREIIRQVRKGNLSPAAQRKRLAVLKGISSDHLPKLYSVQEDAQTFTLRLEKISGPLLTTVRSAKSGLTLGEGWRLAADIAAALEDLHAQGIVHGDVSPANIIIRDEHPRGRAVLIDVGAEEDWEIGTVGFRAPEVIEGAQGDARADVWAAARVALWSVQTGSRSELGERLAQVLQAPAAERPNAAWLHEYATQRASDRVELPDEAQLATAHLRAQAAQVPTMTATRRRRRRSPWRELLRRMPRGWQRGVRRTGPPRLMATLVVIAVALGTYAAADLGMIPRTVPPAAASLEKALAPPRPVRILQVLSAIRDEALSGGDADLLASVTVPGSPAAQQDAELFERMRGSLPEGLRTTHEVIRMSRVGEDVVVEAAQAQGAFTWVGGGKDGVMVASLLPRCVRLHLTLERGSWLVQGVSACAAETMSG